MTNGKLRYACMLGAAFILVAVQSDPALFSGQSGQNSADLLRQPNPAASLLQTRVDQSGVSQLIAENRVVTRSMHSKNLFRDSLGAYVRQNFDALTNVQNAIGYGCAAHVNGFEFEGRDLVIKHYNSARRYNDESTFFRQVSHLNLPIIPRVYFEDASRSVVVMDQLWGHLRRHLLQIDGERGALAGVLRDLFDALAVLHGHGIVHGDLHTENIMVHDGKLMFIDFGDAFLSDNAAIDLLRLQHWVLSRIPDWEQLVPRDELKNPEAFAVIEKIYADRRIAWVFWAARSVSGPRVQYQICRALSVFTPLNALVAEYAEKVSTGLRA